MSASVYYYVWPAVTALGGRESHIKITDDSPGITTGELVPALYGQPAPALVRHGGRQTNRPLLFNEPFTSASFVRS